MGGTFETGGMPADRQFLLVFKHKTHAAEQDGAYSKSIDNVFKLNTPWIQDSRCRGLQGKSFPES